MAYEFAYPVVLTEEPSGGYVASCPDLPEVLSQGEDRREAVAEATDALEEAIAGRIRRGEGIPEPSAVAEDEDVEVVRVPPIMAAKAALAIALGESGLNQSAFARQIGADEKEVRRLLDPRHPSKLPRLQRALQAVNQYVELRVVRMATPEILETRPRSYRELVDLAESLASMHFPEAVERGGPVPVVEVLAPHRLSAIAGVPVRPVVEDALVEDGASEYVSGELVLRLRGEVRRRAEAGDGRCRFTIAHEVAHVILHHEDLEHHQGRAFRDVVTPTEKLPPGVPIFRSPEWQANVWAAAFLMPLSAVRSYLQHLARERAEFTPEGFAAAFQVSRQAATIRLERLLPVLIAPHANADAG